MEINELEKYKVIGGRIQKSREDAGLTQGQLAKAVGYQSATAISFIESGERKLKVGELEKIAKAVKQDSYYLLTGKLDKTVTVRTALRAEHKDLSPDSIDKIESFINFVKNEQNGRGTSSKK